MLTPSTHLPVPTTNLNIHFFVRRLSHHAPDTLAGVLNEIQSTGGTVHTIVGDATQVDIVFSRRLTTQVTGEPS